MNAPHPLDNQLALGYNPQAQPVEERDGLDLAEYWDIIVDSRWLITAILLLALLVGGAYAYLARPIYEANLLVQVEDSSGGGAKAALGDAAQFFEVKTPASAEIEILRSRMVVGKAVENLRTYIDARPRYLPLVGAALARRADGLSNPGFLGLGGYVYGSELINVESIMVPSKMEGSIFNITAMGNSRFSVKNRFFEKEFVGQVGAPFVHSTQFGTVTLNVTALHGLPGAEFQVVRRPRLSSISSVQANLKLTEKGRSSGVIEVTMQGTDPDFLSSVLNEIGKQYVRQNVERKAAEAEKTLAFLDTQLPQFKRQLDQAEDAYNRYRNQQGTVALDEEARLILNRSVDLQSKLLEAQQKRREFVSRFTADHPSVKALDDQIRAWGAEIGALNSRVKGMPSVQQDALRLERDVKVNNELYSQLRNNALQLQLVREGKVGNVRLIDEAVVPEHAVKPNRSMILVSAALMGLVGGVMLALARTALFRGLRNPQEIEAATGLNVFSTIPLSHDQDTLAGRAKGKLPGIHLLVLNSPNDPAVESLRSLRTALQFAMLDASNNRILITGPTPGVGKSFVSTNFAALLATAGKRVLLVDADLRKGYINQYFGLQRSRGLSEVIAGTLKPSEVIHRDVVPNLDVMTTGLLPPNPAELMMSGTLAIVMENLSARYDYIIMDTPPVLAAADTLGMASSAGTLLLVARAGDTQIGELHECTKRLAHSGKVVNGVLFNALDMSRRHYGSYSYKYGGYRYRQYSYEPVPRRG